MATTERTQVGVRRIRWLVLAGLLIGLATAALSQSTASAAPGDYTVSSTDLDFGAVYRGEEKTLEVTITNATGVTQSPVVQPSPADDPAFNVSSSCDNVILGPGEACTVSYSFRPDRTTTFDSFAPLHIDNVPHSVGLDGTGISPYLVEPEDLDFGEVHRNETKTLDLTITNISNIDRTPNVQAGGPDDPVFRGTSNCTGVTLAPGRACTVTYTFQPDRTTTFDSFDPLHIDNVPYSIGLDGTGISPYLVEPEDLDFGEVRRNETKTLDLTITNASNIDRTPNVQAGGPDDPAFGGTSNCTGVTLGPGEACTVNYTFQPDRTGTFHSFDPLHIDNAPYSIGLDGTGISPFTVEPRDLDFGEVFLGERIAKDITVTNVSNIDQRSDVTNIEPYPPGDQAGFTALPPTCGFGDTATLSPGETCTVTFGFEARTLGPAESTGTFTIGGTDYTPELTGTGISPFAVAPLDLDFGEVVLGEQVSKNITVTNISNLDRPGDVSGIEPYPPGDQAGFTALPPTCGFGDRVTVAPGETCTVTFGFQPRDVGPVEGTGTFTIGGTGYTSKLTGTGISAFAVAPLDLDFGEVKLGERSGDKIVTITNRSHFIHPMNLSGPVSDTTGYDLATTCPTSTSPGFLDPGESCTITFAFEPQDLGATQRSAAYAIISAGRSDYFTVSLTGVGISPYTIEPLDLDFGVVAVGEQSQPKEMIITNISTIERTPAPDSAVLSNGAHFDTTDGCTGMLAPGASCTVSYTFSPAAAGTFEGNADFLLEGRSELRYKVKAVGTGVAATTPTAALINDGPVDEGDPATVSFTDQDDPGGPLVEPFRYSYDWNNDGTFEITDSSEPSLEVPAEFTADGPATLTVRARITNQINRFSDYTTEIVITNVAPTTMIDGPSAGETITPISFQLAVTDPSPIDQAADFTYAIDWDGDGTVDETVTGPAGRMVTHSYSAPGSYPITVTVADKDNSVGTATHPVIIAESSTPTEPPTDPPTDDPTGEPTDEPTDEPSDHPTGSATPTDDPSSADDDPSSDPTLPSTGAPVGWTALLSTFLLILTGAVLLGAARRGRHSG